MRGDPAEVVLEALALAGGAAAEVRRQMEATREARDELLVKVERLERELGEASRRVAELEGELAAERATRALFNSEER